MTPPSLQLRRPGESASDVAAWLAEDAHPPSQASMPSASECEALLDAAFFASLEDEEGRRVRFALAFVPADDAVRSFSTREPLSPRALRKLSPAFDPWRCSIAVRFEDGKPVLWGMLPRPPNAAYPSSRNVHPWAVVRTVGTGALVVELRGRAVASFTEGTATRAVSMADVILRVPRLMGVAIDSDAWKVFVGIVRRMQTLGHGGTLVVVTKDDIHQIPQLQATRVFEPADKGLATAAAAARASNGGLLGTLGRGECRKAGDVVVDCPVRMARADLNKLGEEVDSAAQLSGVDGAVVISTSMLLLGFGAFFEGGELPDNKRLVRMHRDAVHHDVPLHQVGGSRHQSACRWVAANPDEGVAFVVSHDGDAHVVAGADDGVLMMGPLWIDPASGY